MPPVAGPVASAAGLPSAASSALHPEPRPEPEPFLACQGRLASSASAGFLLSCCSPTQHPPKIKKKGAAGARPGPIQSLPAWTQTTRLKTTRLAQRGESWRNFHITLLQPSALLLSPSPSPGIIVNSFGSRLISWSIPLVTGYRYLLAFA